MRPLPRLLRYAPKAREGTLKLHFYLESILRTYNINIKRAQQINAAPAEERVMG